MSGKKRKAEKQISKADFEIMAASENMLIEKEKRFQEPLRKMRRPQVEKLTTMKESRKKALPKPQTKGK